MTTRRKYKFRLYIADHTPNSVRAKANLAALCKGHLANRYEIELVDVLKDPKRALTDGIFMTPTLIMHSPGPSRRIVGTLTETQPVLAALGIEAHAPAG
jgi:circadian clock protein KaiB